jgi:hypothetical protein
MTILSITVDGHTVKLNQHDGKTCTLYEVSYDGKALNPTSNLTIALDMFETLSERTRYVRGN